MIALFCGSTGWTDIEPILADMRKLDPDATIVVQGGNKYGADLLAKRAAKLCKIHCAEVCAYWDVFTRATAGKWRNDAMMLLKPDEAYAYMLGTPGAEGTPGTESMIGLLIRGRVPLYVRRPE